MSSPPPIPPAKFIGFLVAILLTFVIAIEAASWLLLTAMDAKVHARYNRVISGYSVFSATPNFTFLTSKTDASQVDGEANALHPSEGKQRNGDPSARSSG